MRILVTDIHELAGLGTLRSLGRAGHEVLGVYPANAEDVLALRSRFLTRGIAGPAPWERQHEYRDWLARLVGEERIDVLFPVSEASQVAVRAVAGALPPAVRVLIPDEGSLRFSLSKLAATRAALAAGIPVPDTVFLAEGGAPRRDALADWSFPYLVKSDNAELDDGSYLRGSTYRIHTRADLDAVLERLASTGASAIAQRIVPGSGVGAFVLRSGGRNLLEYAHERLHEVPYEGGWSSLRRSSEDPRIGALARRLLEATDYQGLAMVEFRRSDEDGTLRFLEINGRPWGSMALALHAGYDFPLATLAAALGEQVPAPASRAGTRRVYCVNLYPGEVQHLVSVLKAPALSRGAKARRLLRSGFEVVRYALDPRMRGDFLWWSDPAPGLAQLGALGRWAFQRVSVRIGLPAPPELPGPPASRPDLAACRRLLFLCSGNICRSPFAEHRARAFSAGNGGALEVASAGLAAKAGSPVPVWFRGLFERFEIEWRGHGSRQVTAPDSSWADLVIVMEHAHRAMLLRSFPEVAGKVWLLGELVGSEPVEVADPYSLGPSDAAAVFETLDRRVQALYAAIAAAKDT